jgi:hypothetical protein
MTVIFYHAAPGETINPNKPSQSVRQIFDIEDLTTKSRVGRWIPERNQQKQWTRENFINACREYLVSTGHPDAWTTSTL